MNGNPNMQFVLRCFLKPDGHQGVDFLLPPGATINDIMPVIKTDGWFWGDGRQCVAADSIMWMTLIPQNGVMQPEVTVNKPNLTVVPLRPEQTEPPKGA